MPLHKSARWMGSRVKPKPNGEPQTTHLCQLLLSREKPAPPCRTRIGSVQESSPLSQGLLGRLTHQGVDGRFWLKTMQQLRVPVEPTLAGCLVLRPLLSLGVSKNTGQGLQSLTEKSQPCLQQAKPLLCTTQAVDQFPGFQMTKNHS